MSWKYVVIKQGNNELPVIFPANMVHLHVVGALKSMIVAEVLMVCPVKLSPEKQAEIAAAIEVVAAGELAMTVVSAGGFSETLGIGSRPDDARDINMHPYTHGYVDPEQE